jgi:hypothetical protein
MRLPIRSSPSRRFAVVAAAALVAAVSVSCKTTGPLGDVSTAAGVTVGYQDGLETVKDQRVGLRSGYYGLDYFETVELGGKTFVRDVQCQDTAIDVVAADIQVTGAGDIVAVKDRRSAAAIKKACSPHAVSRMPLRLFENFLKLWLADKPGLDVASEAGTQRIKDEEHVSKAWKAWRGFDEHAVKHQIAMRYAERRGVAEDQQREIAIRREELAKVIDGLDEEETEMRASLQKTLGELDASYAKLDEEFVAINKAMQKEYESVKGVRVDRDVAFATLIGAVKKPDENLVVLASPSTAGAAENKEHANVSNEVGAVYAAASSAFVDAFRWYRDRLARDEEFEGVAGVVAKAPSLAGASGAYRLLSITPDLKLSFFEARTKAKEPLKPGADASRADRSADPRARGCANVFGAGFVLPSYDDLKRDKAALLASPIKTQLGGERVWVSDEVPLIFNKDAVRYVVALKEGLWNPLAIEKVETVTSAGVERRAVICYKPA